MDIAPPAASWATSEATRRSMRGNVGRGTTPEMALRRELHRRGLRFRVQVPVPGRRGRTMDVAWSGLRIAVFVDGCFWHGCPKHATRPTAHSAYWREKLERNVQRDRDTDAHLSGLGWVVLRIWEHEDMSAAAERIAARVEERRATPPRSQ